MTLITIVSTVFGVITFAYAQNSTAHIITRGKHIRRRIYHRSGAHYIRYNNEFLKIIYE